MDHIGFTTVGELAGDPTAQGAGIVAHVNGDPDMPPETKRALAQLITLVHQRLEAGESLPTVGE